MKLEKHQAIAKDLSSASDMLYIFFGGIAGGMGIPPYEFMRASNALNANKIFVRDLAQCWYQAGDTEYGSNIFSLCEYLQYNLNKISPNPEKVYFIGNSMGGYAAILLGCLLDVGVVHAFSPQTFISPVRRMLAGDNRWVKQIMKTYINSSIRPHIYDVKKYMPKNRSSLVNVYVSNVDKLDFLHAQYISSFPYVKIHEYDKGGHGLVSHLRETGVLSSILSAKY